jgi:hypothetical protein
MADATILGWLSKHARILPAEAETESGGSSKQKVILYSLIIPLPHALVSLRSSGLGESATISMRT